MRVLLGWVVLGVAACSSGGGSQEVLFVEVSAFVAPQAAGFTFDGLGSDHRLMQRNLGHGAAVGDYDGDGDLDIYLLTGGGLPNRLLRNDAGTFNDVTPPLLADLGISRVAHFADLDNDGDLDLLLINDDDGATAHPCRIFRSEGDGTFTDATPGSGFRPIGFVRGGCALADFDRDGLLDILVTNWSRSGTLGIATFPGFNVLFRNRGGLEFEDVTDAVGLGGVNRDCFSAIFTDFDDDGYPDIYIAVDHQPDLFYRNVNGVFENATTEVNATHVGNDMGVACADFDDDGDLDLYATNITDPTGVRGTTQGNVLYVNNNGVFIDEARDRGVFDTYWGWGVEFFDADNDGDLDLAAVTGFDEFVANRSGVLVPLHSTPSVLLLNDGRGRFARRYDTTLDVEEDSRALIAFDYDRDGDLDLLITNIGTPARLIENRNAGGHWLGVALSPDSLAIGARVYATFGGVTKRRDVIAGRSYLAGTPSEVHFGLGDATVIDTLRVRWADGTEQVLRDVAADQLLRVTPP